MVKISPEQAEDVLHRYPRILTKDTPERRYWLALRDSTLPEFFYSELKSCRYDRRDDLPSVDVRTLPGVGFEKIYKCQGHTMIYITSLLRNTVEQGTVVQPELQQEIAEFLQSDLNFQVGDPQNQARIDRINGILDKTLNYLGKTYGIDQATP